MRKAISYISSIVMKCIFVQSISFFFVQVYGQAPSIDTLTKLQ